MGGWNLDTNVLEDSDVARVPSCVCVCVTYSAVVSVQEGSDALRGYSNQTVSPLLFLFSDHKIR